MGPLSRIHRYAMNDDKPNLIDPTVVKNWNTDDNPDGKTINTVIDVVSHLSFTRDALNALMLRRAKDDVLPRGFDYSTDGGVEPGRDAFFVVLKAVSLDGRGKWAKGMRFHTRDVSGWSTGIPTARGVDLGTANVIAAKLNEGIQDLADELPRR